MESQELVVEIDRWVAQAIPCPHCHKNVSRPFSVIDISVDRYECIRCHGRFRIKRKRAK